MGGDHYQISKKSLEAQCEKKKNFRPEPRNLLEIPGTKGNLRGKNGRSSPFWTFQSTGFRPVASTFTRTSSFFGLGMGTSTCCNGKFQFIRTHNSYLPSRKWVQLSEIYFFSLGYFINFKNLNITFERETT